MKVMSIINYKGGVGKTTLTANIALGLASKGHRVLIVDLDPQTNLTFSFIKIEEWQKYYAENRTIRNWFDGVIDQVEVSFEDLKISVGKNLYLISSHLELMDIDRHLIANLMGTERTARANHEKTYSYILQEIQSIRGEYDYVLFDCPPNFSIVTQNALIASDYYMIPSKMDYTSTMGVSQLKSQIDKMLTTYNELSRGRTVSPEFLGVIATMVGVQGNQANEMQKINKRYVNELRRAGIEVFDSFIREDKAVYGANPIETGHAIDSKLPVETYASARYELRQIVKEIMVKTKNPRSRLSEKLQSIKLSQ